VDSREGYYNGSLSPFSVAGKLPIAGVCGMTSKPPYFRFFVKEWRSSPDVRRMTVHQRGIYIELLAASWDSAEPGTLPLPIEDCAKVSGVDSRSLRRFLKEFPKTFERIFEDSSKPFRNGFENLVNQKLRTEWAGILQAREKQADAGKKGNAKRWSYPSGTRSGEDRYAFAVADAEKDLNLGKPQNPRLVSPPPDSNSEKQKQNLEPQQIEFGIVAKLVNGAIGIVARAKAAGKGCFSTDCREELKIWAQDRGFDWNGDRITKAIEAAEEKLRGNPLEKVTELAKSKAVG
jgi:uncharacterized protein YdaU (DUF1376 family)